MITLVPKFIPKPRVSGAFLFSLLPAAGYRVYSDGQLYSQTSFGDYWVQAISTTHAQRLHFDSTGLDTNANLVWYAHTLRCIKI